MLVIDVLQFPSVGGYLALSLSLSLSLSAPVTTRSPLVLVHNPRNVSMVIPCHCLLTAHQGNFYFKAGLNIACKSLLKNVSKDKEGGHVS